MKLRLSRLVLFVILATCSTWLMAQDDTGSGKGKSGTRTIAGCLTQGDNANEFLLTSSDGSTWEVRSDTVSLADHVGHTISATGVVSNATAHNLKEDAKDAASDAHMTKNNSEHGHMKVTDVKMVSHSCKQ
jgi:hypothetical protein